MLVRLPFLPVSTENSVADNERASTHGRQILARLILIQDCLCVSPHPSITSRRITGESFRCPVIAARDKYPVY